jgi:hypothetical protein
MIRRFEEKGVSNLAGERGESVGKVREDGRGNSISEVE